MTKDHAGGVPPTQIGEAEQGGLETPEDTAKPSHNQADKLSELEMSILSWWDDRDEYWATSYKGLAQHTGKTRDELKPGVESLKARGFLKFCRGLMNDEGEVGGAGWEVTPLAREMYWEQKEADDAVSDLPTEDSKPSTGYSKAQRIAEYKQLLASLPSPANPKTDTDKGWNGALDACRALIEARIKELTDEQA